ncbi:unnamed protein product [Phaeothamnion confervicola]
MRSRRRRPTWSATRSHRPSPLAARQLRWPRRSSEVQVVSERLCRPADRNLYRSARRAV